MMSLSVPLAHAYPFSIGAARSGSVTPAISQAAVTSAITELLADVEPEGEFASVAEFYRSRGFAPVWVQDADGRRRLAAVRGVLADAFEHGLDPNRYDLRRSPLECSSVVQSRS